MVLALVVGHKAAAFARARPIFDTFGHATHVGPSGTGQLAKLGSQIIFAAALGAISEALLLTATGGADPAKVREALSGGFADSKVLQIHGQRMLERNFVPGGHVHTHLKDIDAALAAAAEHRLELPVTQLVRSLLNDLDKNAGGKYDSAALLLGLEQRNAPARLGTGVDRLP